jgi:hypothetical protein
MKFSFSLFLAACALPSVVSFVPMASARSTPTSLKATVEGTRLIPPQKVADLANTASDVYNENVQKTYGYVMYTRL